MEAINNYIEKNIKNIITFFLFIQPLIDVITALEINVLKINITISAMIRLLFLIFCIYYLIILNKTENKKKNKKILLLITIYIILFSIMILIYKGANAYAYELKNTINTLYLPIILLALTDIFKQYEIRINNKTITKIFLIYITFIIIPNLTKSGFSSYSESKLGCTGWFDSANAIGNILSILLPLITIYILKIEKNKLINAIIILSTLYVFLSIGTKVPIFSLIICLIINFVYYIIKWIKEKDIKKISTSIISIAIIIISAIIILPKTSFYKNLEIHKNYLKINNYYEIFTRYELIDHFIFSQRLTFLENTNKNYINAKLGEKILGIGYIENYGTDNISTKTIEIDYFDIFYRNGIIVVTIYLLVLIPILKDITKKIKEKNLINIEFKTSIILIFVLALFSGHILTTPAVSIYVALILGIIKGGNYEKIN